MSIEINNSPLLADANLQGYWRLEADGTDSGPNGYNLTGTAPSYVAGKFGNAGDFEATSTQYLTNATVPNLRATGSQTFGCWIKAETAALSRVMGRSNAGSPFNLVNIGISVGTGAGAHASVQMQGLTTNTYVEEAGTISTGTWYFICGVYDSANSKLKIWKDATKTEVTASGTATSNGAESFSVGRCGAYAGDYFDGIVDDPFFFNRALTDAEVLNIYNNHIMPATVGSISLTGIDTAFSKALNMAAGVGEYVLTGISVILRLGYSIITTVGEFILTGIDITMTKGNLWTKRTKPTTNWSERTKPTTNWTNRA